MKKILTACTISLSLLLVSCSQPNSSGTNANNNATPQGVPQGPRADINGTIKSIDGNIFVIEKRNFPTPSESPRTDMTQEERESTRTEMQNIPQEVRDATRTALQNIPLEDITIIIPATASISKQQGGRGMMGGGRPGGPGGQNNGQGQGGGQWNGGTGGAQQRQGGQGGQNRMAPPRVLGSFADLEVGATVQLWFDTNLNDGKTVKQVVVMSAMQQTPTP